MAIFKNKRKAILLLSGDVLFLVIALWSSLLIRNLEFPRNELFLSHLIPFSILFVIWILAFFVAGLYEKQTLILKNVLPNILLRTQIINIIIAVLFFYFIPYFNIRPKTNLFLYLIISSGLILLWRLYLVPFFVVRQSKHNAIIIGSGSEVKELWLEVNNNTEYPFKFVQSIEIDNLDHIDFQEEVVNKVYVDDISLIVADIRNPKVESILPQLYNLIFSNTQFIDTYRVYESVFNRIPVSIVGYTWFLENVSSRKRVTYDAIKRIMDIVISAILGILSLIFYPIVIVLIWLDDRGNAFIVQDRIGKGGKRIKLFKFRSMNVSDGGKWVTDDDNRITRIGKILRSTRIDELPQLWNVLRGDISLIGPRPDILNNFITLKEELPYYTIRNIVKPGLSGWAQINQENPPQSIEETKIRLTYDLYYIKNRSLLLDIKIVLQTIKTLMSRTGR